MTEATGKEMTPELKRWLESWKSGMQEVISQVAGQALSLNTSEEHLAPLPDDVWYAVSSAGTVSGEMSLRLSAAIGSILGQTLLGDAQPAAGELTADRKEALDELLRQVAGHVATSLSSPAGEVQLHVASSAAPTWSSAISVSLQKASETGPPLAVEIQISAALLSALSPRPKTDQSPTTAPEPVTANFERLMDVELEVKLRFGARRMELREVLALSPGSVVELDRNLQAPVDLLLDGRVIALGDVVVVDGKYGLRITEVVNPGSAA
jgi:flagellar motor switch protein FliN/FliY